MRNLMKFALGALVLSGIAHAQNLTAAHQRYFTPVRRNLEASADAMPADKYGYRLTEGQMTFAEGLIHSAQRNYSDCATIQGEQPPEAAKQLDGLKTKEDVSKALKESFAYCAAALGKVDDAKMISSPQISYAFLHIVVHNNEIYGNLVGYLRSNGIVPPSSAGRGAQKKN